MVGITVNDMATLRMRRYDNEGNARPISEEIKRLDETRIIIPTAFVESDEYRCVLEQLRFGLHALNYVAGERFEEVEFGTPRMSVSQHVWLDVGHSRQPTCLDICDQILRVLQVLRT